MTGLWGRYRNGGTTPPRRLRRQPGIPTRALPPRRQLPAESKCAPLPESVQLGTGGDPAGDGGRPTRGDSLPFPTTGPQLGVPPAPKAARQQHPRAAPATGAVALATGAVPPATGAIPPTTSPAAPPPSLPPPSFSSHFQPGSARRPRDN